MLESFREAIERVQQLPGTAAYRHKLTNTFGVVVECDAPRPTRGSDLIQSVKLVDDSLPDAVELVIFSSRVDQMPRPQLGDVLELRDVCVQFFQDKPQLFAKMALPHAFGFLLYRPALDGSASAAAAGAAPAPQPLQLFNTDRDSRHAARRMQELTPLLQQVVGFTPSRQDAGSGGLYLRKLRELSPPEQPGERPACIDMRVQVLAVDTRCPEEGTVLFVWDGTDTRPIPASLQLLPSQWKQHPELRMEHPRRRSLPLAPQPPGVAVVPQLPPLGTALPVVIQPGALPTLPRPGEWVKIKVVGLAAVQGQWQVVFGRCSRLTQSQPAPGFEAAWQARLDSQDTSDWLLDPQQLATACSLRALPRVTVRQVLLAAAARQQGPFRVQLRLVGYLPRDVRSWCQARTRPAAAADGSSSSSGAAAWEWAAHLLLEDATADVRALLLGDEATNVLGLHPTNLSHADDVLQLQQALHYLSSVDADGGVWMEVALTPLYPAARRQQQQQQQQQQEREQEREQEQELELEPQQQQEQGASRSADQAGTAKAAQAAAAAAATAPIFIVHNAVCKFMQQQLEQQRAQQAPQEQLAVGDAAVGVTPRRSGRVLAAADTKPPSPGRSNNKRRRQQGPTTSSGGQEAAGVA